MPAADDQPDDESDVATVALHDEAALMDRELAEEERLLPEEGEHNSADKDSVPSDGGAAPAQANGAPPPAPSRASQTQRARVSKALPGGRYIINGGGFVHTTVPSSLVRRVVEPGAAIQFVDDVAKKWCYAKVLKVEQLPMEDGCSGEQNAGTDGKALALSALAGRASSVSLKKGGLVAAVGGLTEKGSAAPESPNLNSSVQSVLGRSGETASILGTTLGRSGMSLSGLDQSILGRSARSTSSGAGGFGGGPPGGTAAGAGRGRFAAAAQKAVSENSRASSPGLGGGGRRLQDIVVHAAKKAKAERRDLSRRLLVRELVDEGVGEEEEGRGEKWLEAGVAFVLASSKGRNKE